MVQKNEVTYPDFSSGELSPKMWGRFDAKAFYSGGRRVENFIPQSTGGAHFRTGTMFAAKTAGNNKAFLYTFKYTDSLSFILEFTDQKLRFYRNNGRVHETAQDITAITNTNPAVVTYSGADNYSNGDPIFIDGVLGMTELNGNEYVVANVNAGANTFELSGVDSTSYGTYSSGGEVAVIVEVATPYAEADLFQLKFAQKGVDLYIAHPTYNPKKLTYTSPTSWAIADHSPIVRTLGDVQKITAISNANPAVVTYAGADNFSNGDTVKLTGITGMVELADGDYEIASVNTGANTFQLVGVDSSGWSSFTAGAVTVYDEAAAPFLSTDNYPRAVGLYEQRLVYGGSNNSPQTLWFSMSNETDDFSIGTEADDGMQYTIAGDGQFIRWIAGTDRFLAVGTFSDVLKVTGGIEDVITPTSISIKPSNSSGCADVMPLGCNNDLYFLQRDKLTLRSFEYDFRKDSYISVNRNTIADHVTKTGLEQITYLEGSSNIILGVRADGVIAGMTVDPQEGISGWHRQKTNGEFVSVAVTPRGTKYDQAWVCVKRNGNYYIEYFADEIVHSTIDDFVDGTESSDKELWENIVYESMKEYVYVDSALSYDGSLIGADAGATMTPGAATGASVTFTASASVFSASDVGRQIWRKSVTGAETGRAEITAYTSGTVVTCEILEDFDSTTAIPAGEWFLTADELSGLDHLEGETVSVIADGGQHSQVVVSSGAISLDDHSSVFHVGLPYKGYLETNDLEGGGVTGAAQTKRKKLYAVGFRFFQTLFAKYGTSYYNLIEIPQRTAAMKMDRPPLIFTGDTKEHFSNQINDKIDGGWTREKRCVIVQDQPFPCNVQLIVPYLETSN